jgi:serine/threonine protein kinase
MASLAHPHLAQIYGAESWRGAPVLVVEFLEGGTLADRLPARIAVPQALAWGAALASALEAMHRRGLLHRDVKPSNIGFTSEGTPKLLDFGLARLVGEAADADEPGPRVRQVTDPALTRSHHVLGTPLYLSPEQLRGAPPSAAQDLWALSVVLWEMLVGRHPGDANPREQLVAERPDCPPALVEFLARGLSRRPEARPPSAEAYVAALGRLGAA